MTIEIAVEISVGTSQEVTIIEVPYNIEILAVIAYLGTTSDVKFLLRDDAVEPVELNVTTDNHIFNDAHDQLLGSIRNTANVIRLTNFEPIAISRKIAIDHLGSVGTDLNLIIFARDVSSDLIPQATVNDLTGLLTSVESTQMSHLQDDGTYSDAADEIKAGEEGFQIQINQFKQLGKNRG